MWGHCSCESEIDLRGWDFDRCGALDSQVSSCASIVICPPDTLLAYIIQPLHLLITALDLSVSSFRLRADHQVSLELVWVEKYESKRYWRGRIFRMGGGCESEE